MAIDVAGIGAAATAVKDVLGMIFPDKTEEEKARLAATLSLINAQTDIDKAEAQSSDPLQHWRGGLGWVCVFAYFWNFVGEPMITAGATLAGHPVALPMLNIEPLAALTMGMLGIGGLHVMERVKGAA